MMFEEVRHNLATRTQSCLKAQARKSGITTMPTRKISISALSISLAQWIKSVEFLRRPELKRMEMTWKLLPLAKTSNPSSIKPRM